MSRRLMILAALAPLAFTALPCAWGLQDTAPAGATNPAVPEAGAAAEGDGVQHLKIQVTGVEGLVQVRSADDQPWKKAQVGMQLDELAEFRTGTRSAVRFVIPPDQTITLDRLGTVKVLQAIEQRGGKLKTDLGMKYGRTRYDIEAAGREHESTISSPSNTLAVRGTKVSLYDQRPFVSQAVSLTGRAELRDARRSTFFGGKQGKTRITANASAADVALGQAVVDPSIALARTGSESALIATLISRGSTIDFDRETGIKIVRGGTPPGDRELIPVLPGDLNFVLRWTGNADLNLGISSPATAAGETVYPVAGLNIAASGGQTAFDHRGGPNGGIEIAFWKNPVPQGLYGIGVIHITGADATATIDAFQDGQRIDITDFTNGLQKTITADIPADGGTHAVLAAVGESIPGFDKPASARSQAKTRSAPAPNRLATVEQHPAPSPAGALSGRSKR